MSTFLGFSAIFKYHFDFRRRKSLAKVSGLITEEGGNYSSITSDFPSIFLSFNYHLSERQRQPTSARKMLSSLTLKDKNP